MKGKKSDILTDLIKLHYGEDKAAVLHNIRLIATEYAKAKVEEALSKQPTHEKVQAPKNSDVVDKYVIVKDLLFSDFMKDKDGKINVYDNLEQAGDTCGMYEFEDVLVLKVERNYKENQ